MKNVDDSNLSLGIIYVEKTKEGALKKTFLCIKTDYGKALVDLKNFEIVPIQEYHLEGKQSLKEVARIEYTIHLAGLAGQLISLERAMRSTYNKECTHD